MEEFQPPLLPERNPVTTQRHRREVLWQITIPLIVVVLIFLAVAGLVAFRADSATASLWGDISLIWLIIPAFIGGLILLALLAGLAFGVIWLVRNLPPLALKAQNIFVTVGVNVRKATDLAVEPILRVQSTAAALKVLLRKR